MLKSVQRFTGSYYDTETRDIPIPIAIDPDKSMIQTGYNVYEKNMRRNVTWEITSSTNLRLTVNRDTSSVTAYFSVEVIEFN